MNDLGGKIAFVTGASSGIGLGLVKVLAAAGIKVALTYNQARAHSAHWILSNPIYEQGA